MHINATYNAIYTVIYIHTLCIYTHIHTHKLYVYYIYNAIYNIFYIILCITDHIFTTKNVDML